jgi:hypothetical protein
MKCLYSSFFLAFRHWDTDKIDIPPYCIVNQEYAIEIDSEHQTAVESELRYSSLL